MAKIENVTDRIGQITTNISAINEANLENRHSSLAAKENDLLLKEQRWANMLYFIIAPKDTYIFTVR